MGRVYLGWSAGDRLIAVKVIRSELAEDAEFRARFAREVAAARTVSGLYTAAVVDYDVTVPRPWLATAYVAGPSLAEAVQAHGPLPVSTVLSLAAGLAEGLAAVHASGVVHRDLKPANVMIAETGPRVIDFGISRATEASSLTRSGMVLGSPGFMSPEQAEGREVGPPSDVFSLGAVIAFAATGQSPFGTGPTPALIYRLVHAEPDTSGLPDPVRSLVDRCLAKDPQQRPTAQQILAEARAHAPAAGWLPSGIHAMLARYQLTDLAQRAMSDADSPGPVLSDRPAISMPGRKRRSTWVWAVGGLVALAAAAVVASHFVVKPVSATSSASGQHQSAEPATAPGLPDLSTSSLPTTAAPSTSSASPHTPRISTSSPRPQSPTSASQPPAATPPTVPAGVVATAAGQYAIKVTWSDSSAVITGFDVDNGCPAGKCAPGASLAMTTGPVTAIQFTVTPGTYQCFRVRAVNDARSSTWSGYSCASTPGLTVPGADEWTSTGVTVRSGDELGITAAGQIYIDPKYPVSPSGVQSCIPATDHPGGPFPAPNLYCWSLIAKIGSGAPFEVGTSTLITATSGLLYLGVNDDNFTDNSGDWTVRIKLGGLPPT
jgi:serine/threonine protein kinase